MLDGDELFLFPPSSSLRTRSKSPEPKTAMTATNDRGAAGVAQTSSTAALGSSSSVQFGRTSQPVLRRGQSTNTPSTPLLELEEEEEETKVKSKRKVLPSKTWNNATSELANELGFGNYRWASAMGTWPLPIDQQRKDEVPQNTSNGINRDWDSNWLTSSPSTSSHAAQPRSESRRARTEISESREVGSDEDVKEVFEHTVRILIIVNDSRRRLG